MHPAFMAGCWYQQDINKLVLIYELQNGFRIDLADQRGQKSVQEKKFLDKDIKI